MVKCCDNPNVSKMDYDTPDRGRQANRICHNCRRHWFGSIAKVKECSGKEWQKMIDEMTYEQFVAVSDS